MSGQVSTEINGKKLFMVFNLKMLTRLGKFLGMGTLEEVTDALGKLSMLEKGTSIESIELMWAVVYHAVVCVPGQENAVTLEEIESLNLADLTVIAQGMTAGLVDSFPQDVPGEPEEEAENVEPTEKKS